MQDNKHIIQEDGIVVKLFLSFSLIILTLSSAYTSNDADRLIQGVKREKNMTKSFRNDIQVAEENVNNRTSILPDDSLKDPLTVFENERIDCQLDPLTDCLLVIDMQNSFMPSNGMPGTGELPVPEAHSIVSIINVLSQKFMHVAVSLDWHPKDHASFASSHPKKEAFSSIKVSYGKKEMEQILWPNHCVQNSPGSQLHPKLEEKILYSPHVIHKGLKKKVDSYSAFIDAAGDETGFKEYLSDLGVKRLFVTGVATDYCVISSVMDAARMGFDVFLIWDACKGVAQGEALSLSIQKIMRADPEAAKRIRIINSTVL